MRAVKTLAVAVLGASLLAGCGMFGTGDPDPDPTSTDGGTGTESSAPEGPSPEDLAEEVFAAAEQADSAAVIGSGSGVTTGQTQVTIEVTAVERSEDSTVVRMRLSGVGTGLGGPAGFGNSKYDGISFARTLYLVDPTVTRTRYLPLQFTDYREACLCPYFPMELGAEPQSVTAVYPPLPDTVTTVDLVANDFLTVTGLPVGG